MIRKALSWLVIAGLMVPAGALRAQEKAAESAKAEIARLHAIPASVNLLAQSAAGRPAAERSALSPADAAALAKAQAGAPGLLSQKAGADKDVDVVEHPPYVAPNQNQDEAAAVAIVLIIVIVVVVVAVAAASAPASSG